MDRDKSLYKVSSYFCGKIYLLICKKRVILMKFKDIFKSKYVGMKQELISEQFIYK